MLRLRKWTPTGGERGAVAVEFVIIFPILFLFICGIIEFGRIMAFKNLATSAAREGARTAILPGAAIGDVITKVKGVLFSLGLSEDGVDEKIADGTIGIFVGDWQYGPGDATDPLEDYDGGDPITIQVLLDYGGFALVPGFVDWIVLDGTVTMRKETFS
ncbi:MAG: TadE/TadG family type IV pilus assembly protein [bacterium]